jgi:hypothetical protein
MCESAFLQQNRSSEPHPDFVPGTSRMMRRIRRRLRRETRSSYRPRGSFARLRRLTSSHGTVFAAPESSSAIRLSISSGLDTRVNLAAKIRDQRISQRLLLVDGQGECPLEQLRNFWSHFRHRNYINFSATIKFTRIRHIHKSKSPPSRKIREKGGHRSFLRVSLFRGFCVKMPAHLNPLVRSWRSWRCACCRAKSPLRKLPAGVVALPLSSAEALVQSRSRHRNAR